MGFLQTAPIGCLCGTRTACWQSTSTGSLVILCLIAHSAQPPGGGLYRPELVYGVLYCLCLFRFYLFTAAAVQWRQSPLHLRDYIHKEDEAAELVCHAYGNSLNGVLASKQVQVW